MGGALLEGWLSALESPQWHLQVVHPRPPEKYLESALKKFPSLSWEQDFLSLPQDPDLLVFAVKPQVVEKVVRSYQSWIPASCLVVSVAAGKTFSFFQSILGDKTPLIRAMPNLAVAVGKGLVGMCKNSAVTPLHQNLFEDAFKGLGTLYSMDEEKEMDLFTLVGGSGPAFLYAFMEALEEAAHKLGMSPLRTPPLLQAMGEGAMAFLSHSGLSMAEAREKITSPQGVTEAGLKSLIQSGLEKMVLQAAQAALHRTEELRKG
jgi:pyrroline-5-carboxylate reductase